MTKDDLKNKPGYIPLVSYEKILAALDGDTEAILEILESYDKYITSLATVKSHHPDGTTRSYADPAIKSRLQAKLCSKINKFDPTLIDEKE